MTGFAIAGPGYLTGVEGDDAVKAVQTFKTLSLILMASRLILVVQYGVVLLFLRQFSKARLPLFIHMAVLLAASMVYLGIFFAFYFNANTGYTLIAWYIAIGFEALAILLVSAQVKFITLRKTYIVERLGLLTLIILGEGVIGICASINKVGSDRSFSSDVIGMIISSIGIIYFLWMMYFDQVLSTRFPPWHDTDHTQSETKHVGTIRQQFWTICHFPFHAAVLLTVEGVAQFSVWRKVLDVINQWETNVYQAANYPTNGNTTIMVEYLNQTINALYEQFPASKAPYMDFTGDFQALQNSSLSNDTLQDVLGDIDYNGIVYIATSFGIEPPKKFEDPSEDQLEGISETFEAVFLYFFAAAGLALVFMAILFFLGKRYKVRGDYVSIAVRVLVGVGLGLLTLMDLTSSAENAYANYAGGPWLLPTVVLAYGFGTYRPLYHYSTRLTCT
jgi:low temperature requirement protein LtrA